MYSTVQLPANEINHTDHSAMQTRFESKMAYFLKCPYSNPEYDLFFFFFWEMGVEGRGGVNAGPMEPNALYGRKYCLISTLEITG